MIYKILILVCSLVFSVNAYSANKNCHIRKLTKVYVQADRFSGKIHSNKMMIGFEGCPGVTLGYLENTHPAFSGMLSIALTAYTTDKSILIMLNDDPALDADGSMKIQYLSFQ